MFTIVNKILICQFYFTFGVSYLGLLCYLELICCLELLFIFVPLDFIESQIKINKIKLPFYYKNMNSLAWGFGVLGVLGFLGFGVLG